MDDQTQKNADVLLLDVPDSKARRQLSLMLALGAALGGEEFTTGFNRVMDGQCPDCGQPIETHPDERRCFQQ